jgi:hypothetical protein
MQSIARRLVALSIVLSAHAALAADITQWKFSRPIQFNPSESGANVMGDVKEFPVAIALDARSFDFAQAKDDGSDVYFSGDKDGVPLPHHVELWDAKARTALVWVKVPTVKGNSSDQSIFMHWGNPDASATGDAAKVFSTADGFVGVWHLNEEGNTDAVGYRDATGNADHATGVNLTPGSRVDGRVGKAQLFNYADMQWMKIDNDKRKLFDLTNKLTFSIWANARSFGNKGDEATRQMPGYETMFAKGDNSWRLQKFGIREWHNPPATLVEICVEKAPKGDLCVFGPYDMQVNRWYHFVGVHDYPKARIYVNGVLDKEASFADIEWTSGDHPVGIGNQSQFPQRGRQWDGMLDEARVLNVPKDEHWIKLDYESQREAQRFYTFGAVVKR